MNYFTSDLHLNHLNIIKYCNRPFQSIEEMNEQIVDRWNKKICNKDKVYVVGDVFLGIPQLSQPLIQRMNGEKILIVGNHDKKNLLLDYGFKSAHKRIILRLANGKRALLHHYPLKSSELAGFDVQIHGHTHDGPIVRGKRINVCVDLWDFSPISEDVICQVQLGKDSEDVQEYQEVLSGSMR